MKKRLIIAGSRNIKSANILEYAFRHFDIQPTNYEIVSGLAEGVDLLGKQFAEQNGLLVHEFPAIWYPDGKYDHAAGHKRNRRMGDFADELLAIWDGHSNGTKGMIEYMKKLKKPTHVLIPPTVVNINKDKFDVYIGRGTIWGNPFPINIGIGDTREVVIRRYKWHLWEEIKSGNITEEMIMELDGKRLGCHCKPLQCHGDVLQSCIMYFKEKRYGRQCS